MLTKSKGGDAPKTDECRIEKPITEVDGIDSRDGGLYGCGAVASRDRGPNTRGLRPSLRDRTECVMTQLGLEDLSLETRAVSPYREMGAYEALWCKRDTTFKSLARRFAEIPGSLPSDFVELEESHTYAALVMRRFEVAQVRGFGVRVHGAGEYPAKLRDADHPVELLYYQGWWDLTASRSVAVVGTRNPSQDGLSRTRRLVKELVEDDFTVVSGLATGVDKATHLTAMEQGGRTIAVIGTPISHCYPREHADLQRDIAANFLVVSQVPVERYEAQDFRLNRFFFPARNVTMSALTEATIIVEAGETSGTLVQARAALSQKRKLFVLDNCFRDPRLTWPHSLQAKGAIRVRDYDDIRQCLSNSTD